MSRSEQVLPIEEDADEFNGDEAVGQGPFSLVGPFLRFSNVSQSAVFYLKLSKPCPALCPSPPPQTALHHLAASLTSAWWWKLLDEEWFLHF